MANRSKKEETPQNQTFEGFPKNSKKSRKCINKWIIWSVSAHLRSVLRRVHVTLANNSNFLIPLSLQSDGENLWYYKLWLFDQNSLFEISKVYYIGLPWYRDLKITDCGSISLLCICTQTSEFRVISRRRLFHFWIKKLSFCHKLWFSNYNELF